MNTEFTKVPNYFFEHMASMDKCEQSVVLLIIRKTIGFQKEWDRISFSQFMDEAGLNRNSANKGIKAAIERGIIERRETKNSFEYRISDPKNGTKNVPILEDQELENGTKNEPKIGTENVLLSDNGTENVPIMVQKTNTQKKERNKNIILSDQAPTSDNDEWFSAVCWLVYGHKDFTLLSKADKTAIGKTIKDIRASPNGYKITDLRAWYRDKWSNEWPGKQPGKTDIQRPSLKQIKSGIGQTKPAKANPNGFNAEPNKSIAIVGELEK